MHRKSLLLATFFWLAACDSSDPSSDAAAGLDATVGRDATSPARDLGAPDGTTSDATPADATPADAEDPDGGPADVGVMDAEPADAEAPDGGGCPAVTPMCEGVCALVPPRCDGGNWICDQGPGYEADETICDGFDNDCDGERDEGCPTCTVPEAELRNHLFSIADIDFDTACNGYLTSLVSGPDFTWVVPGSGAPAAQFFGQLNQNMGYALVDPDPSTRRVVVTYSCCEVCGCQAQNGLTLLHTCSATVANCGCSGQSNCPGFLDAPFLAAGSEDLDVPWGTIATPTGLAAGPGGAYFVGNWRPANCGSAPGCTSCGPSDTSFCGASASPCCDDTAAGRLAEFTLPSPGQEASFRVTAVFEGAVILGLASGRRGEVMVGTSSAAGGQLYRYDPIQRNTNLVRQYTGAVWSVTQDRRTGDWYLEEVGTSSTTLHRLSEDGVPLSLPAGLPANPVGRGALQVGPDDRLYRVQVVPDSQAPLDVWDLP